MTRVPHPGAVPALPSTAPPCLLKAAPNPPSPPQLACNNGYNTSAAGDVVDWTMGANGTRIPTVCAKGDLTMPSANSSKQGNLQLQGRCSTCVIAIPPSKYRCQCNKLHRSAQPIVWRDQHSHLQSDAHPHQYLGAH